MNKPRTEAQIEASRINGALSRGPVTEEGKAISSRNGTRHGLLSRTILLPEESAEDFEDLYLSHIGEYQPRYISEFMLVESMVVSKWREMRIWAMNNSKQLDQIDAQPVASPAVARLAMASRAYVAMSDMHKADPTVACLNRYESRFHRQYMSCRRELLALKKARKEPI